jgi:protein ImuB
VAPFALSHTTTGGERLYALEAEAARCGLQVGQSVSDAKALEPMLQLRPADPAGDIRRLAALARGCGRWSPWTAPDPGRPGEDGVLLEITGCAHLFGGEDALLAETLGALRRQGHSAHGAIAPTIGLAWGLARHVAPGRPTGQVITDDITTALAPLPVAALRIGDTAATLRRFGLKRIGDILDLPRASLTRRFGRALVDRLDQATGRTREVLNPLQPVTPFRARTRYVDALLLLDGLKQGVHDTATGLCEALELAGRGVTRLDLHLFRVDGKTHLLTLGTAAPARDARHIARLFNEKLDRAEIDIGFGIEMIELTARVTDRLGERQDGLVESSAVDETDLARLTDRLVVRLGESKVQRAARRASHQPERAALWRPTMNASVHAMPARAGSGRSMLAVAEPVPTNALLPPPCRPLLILARPEPAEAVAEIPDGPPRSFVWRRVRHQVDRAEGPERLAPEWWREGLWQAERPARTRDYFRVETREGRRFWLYRDGLYGLETTRPQWFVHGAS